jgi:hypothetical protein
VSRLGIPFFVVAMFVTTAAESVELKMTCGKLTGVSARLGTETRPAKLEQDDVINGYYSFDLSSKSGQFGVVFQAIEGPIARQVDSLDEMNAGQTIKIVSRPEWGNQVFYLHNGSSQKRMIVTSETKLLSGETSVTIFEAACESKS